jgi:UDP-sulfoquinovose synthase
MRIIIFGADGYLGWPTSMKLASEGHEIIAVDNYLRRQMADETNSQPLMDNPKLEERSDIYYSNIGKKIKVEIGDCTDYKFVKQLFKEYQPDAVIHYAEQPSAPYSMMGHFEATRTLRNNLDSTLNIIFGVIEESPDCHIIKLGTMGEYGTPNIDIEEGWIEIEHNGRKETFLYPRQTGSLYHTTKIMDTDLLWFYVRTYGLKVTDLMQGPVYGLSTIESDLDDKLLPNFHYDDIFGTALNRFLVQAVSKIPLTVYGKGGQTRGYLNIKDTMECVKLALLSPPTAPDLRILNQFTEVFSVNELAGKVKIVGDQLGLKIDIKNYPNPRKETENHYYNPKHTGLLELGLKPSFLTEDVLVEMLEKIIQYKKNIVPNRILPRVRWNK